MDISWKLCCRKFSHSWYSLWVIILLFYLAMFYKQLCVMLNLFIPRSLTAKIRKDDKVALCHVFTSFRLFKLLSLLHFFALLLHYIFTFSLHSFRIVEFFNFLVPVVHAHGCYTCIVAHLGKYKKVERKENC